MCAAWARASDRKPYLRKIFEKKSTFILRIFFKEKSTLRKILTSILIILILIYFIFSFSILNIFNFIICYIHRLAIWMTYDHLFVFQGFQIFSLGGIYVQFFFWKSSKLNKEFNEPIPRPPSGLETPQKRG